MSSLNHYENLPVYKAAYQLTLAIQTYMPRFSRDVRYTIGQGLVKLMMNTIVLVYEANLQRDKHPYLIKGRKCMVEAKVTLRMLCDMHQLSEGQYLQLAQQAEAVSKQLTAWDNKLFKQNNN